MVTAMDLVIAYSKLAFNSEKLKDEAKEEAVQFFPDEPQPVMDSIFEKMERARRLRRASDRLADRLRSLRVR